VPIDQVRIAALDVIVHGGSPVIGGIPDSKFDPAAQHDLPRWGKPVHGTITPTEPGAEMLAAGLAEFGDSARFARRP
jgi:hypothetical protein